MTNIKQMSKSVAATTVCIDVKELSKKINSLTPADQEQVTLIILTYSNVKYTKTRMAHGLKLTNLNPKH